MRPTQASDPPDEDEDEDEDGDEDEVGDGVLAPAASGLRSQEGKTRPTPPS